MKSRAMKKCKCFGNNNDIITWEAPEKDHGDKAKLVHICTRCGYTHAESPDAGHSNTEGRKPAGQAEQEEAIRRR